MLMSYLWTGLVCLSIFCAMLTGNGGKLTSAIMDGAQSAVQLIITMAGSICLWSGLGKLMGRAGITGILTKLLRPILYFLFPSTKQDSVLSDLLSANICANFLGLGNAATPMGVQAARHLVNPSAPETASNELCRLIVLNTASIQFLPTTVAAVRSALGSPSPFDILPAVWITSVFSASLGVSAAICFGRINHQ